MGNSSDVNGLAVLHLRSPGGAEASAGGEAPRFTRAELLPGRAMMVWQLRAALPGRGEVDLLHAPPLEQARAALDAGPPGRSGNNSFKYGGAFLLPFANRIRGRFAAADRALDTTIAGQGRRLFANGGGQAPGAEQYAIHGLILDRTVDELEHVPGADADAARAVIRAGDFGGCWPSDTDVELRLRLSATAFEVEITATNVGEEAQPMGIGWHPYFALPSGAREQARLYLPARTRLEVNDYDEVLPTGRLLPVAGTPHDFSAPGGAALGGLYLDDCFVDLQKTPAGETVVELIDTQAGYGLQVASSSPEISAIQTFAPPDRAFVVLEPQLNWADPFGPLWNEPRGKGMAWLAPGESVAYRVRLSLFQPGPR